MNDYGSDFLLVDDDVVFTADGDAATVSGPACVAQDIDQTLKVSPGVLVWDKEAGSSLLSMLNDSERDSASVIAELERVAIADPRLDPVTVQAKEISAGRFRLSFCVLGAVTPATLEYDLTKEAGNG